MLLLRTRFEKLTKEREKQKASKKKVDEQINTTRQRYAQVSQQHGVSSKIQAPEDVLKQYKKEPVPSYMRRRRKGSHTRATTRDIIKTSRELLRKGRAGSQSVSVVQKKREYKSFIAAYRSTRTSLDSQRKKKLNDFNYVDLKFETGLLNKGLEQNEKYHKRRKKQLERQI